MYELTTLENGLRLLVVPVPHLQSASLGFFLRVGSRGEHDGIGGASHFVEHMLFKGTAHFPSARDIAEAIEGRGGLFNASTGVETTLYWAKVGAANLPQALHVLSDMLLHPTFDSEELEKERGVILEEIKYELDTPDSLVQMRANELQWPGHPLGRDVAGTLDSVAGLSRNGLLDHWANTYLPGETVLGIAGNLDQRGVVDLVRGFLDAWQPGPALAWPPAPPSQPGPRLHVEVKDTEQTHINFSFAGLPRSHPDRFVLRLLNCILGEGMRSRLFQEVRERLGLAYSVESYVNLMQDTGAVGVYAGVATESTEDAIASILGELDLLRQNPVPEEELDRAREYAKGRMALALEDSSTLASWYTRQVLLEPVVQTPAEVMHGYDQVQPADVQRVAQALFQQPWLNLALVGPLDGEEERFGRALRL